MWKGKGKRGKEKGKVKSVGRNERKAPRETLGKNGKGPGGKGRGAKRRVS